MGETINCSKCGKEFGVSFADTRCICIDCEMLLDAKRNGYELMYKTRVALDTLSNYFAKMTEEQKRDTWKHIKLRGLESYFNVDSFDPYVADFQV
jgi:hypothetical protein